MNSDDTQEEASYEWSVGYGLPMSEMRVPGNQFIMYTQDEVLSGSELIFIWSMWDMDDLGYGEVSSQRVPYGSEVWSIWVVGGDIIKVEVLWGYG